MELIKKAAYIKGLMDGLEIDCNDKQAKIIKALVDLVNDMADEISQLEQCYDDVCDRVDAIDEDLAGVEDMLYEEYDDEDEDDKLCGLCRDNSDEEMAYEAVCPTCGAEIGISEDLLNKGGIQCPECGESLEFDYDKDELDDVKE